MRRAATNSAPRERVTEAAFASLGPSLAGRGRPGSRKSIAADLQSASRGTAPIEVKAVPRFVSIILKVVRSFFVTSVAECQHGTGARHDVEANIKRFPLRS